MEGDDAVPDPLTEAATKEGLDISSGSPTDPVDETLGENTCGSEYTETDPTDPADETPETEKAPSIIT
jgi:hypothetical protein